MSGTACSEGEFGHHSKMTLDPSLGYAHRGPRSDASLKRKANVLIQGTRFASLLAYVGAARFLRAQQVGGAMITYYVPVAATLSIAPDTALPSLSHREEAAEHALVIHGLTYALTDTTEWAVWQGLVYHTFQPQGAQQPISRTRGYFDLRWLNSLVQQGNKGMLCSWQAFLSQRQEDRLCEVDALVEALLARRLLAWEAHLSQVAHAIAFLRTWKGRSYHVQEVKEVIKLMYPDTPTPLSLILERKEGTLRFGQALRLLHEQDRASAREVMDDLTAVQTRDQLLLVLGRIVQYCAVAGAKSPFLFLPTEVDCKYLLEDVDHYSAHTVAVLLLLLASLWYPKKEGGTVSEASSDGKEGVHNGDSTSTKGTNTNELESDMPKRKQKR